MSAKKAGAAGGPQGALRLVGQRVKGVRRRRVRTNGGTVSAIERIDLEGASLSFTVHEREETATNGGPYVISMLVTAANPTDQPAAPERGNHASLTISVGTRTFRVTAAQWSQVVSAMNLVDAGEPDENCGYRERHFGPAHDVVMQVRHLLKEVD